MCIHILSCRAEIRSLVSPFTTWISTVNPVANPKEEATRSECLQHYMCVYVYTYVLMYIYTGIHMYIYIYIYIYCPSTTRISTGK